MLRLPVVLLLLGSSLAACQRDNLVCNDPLGCVEVGKNDPISLAVLLPLSGEAADLGEEALSGVEIAVSNQGGGVLGHPLELVTADSVCEAGSAQAELASLTAVSPEVVGIIGPICTAVTEAILPVVSQAGLVMISPANTAVSLTVAPADGGLWQPGYYRTAPPDTRQAQVTAEFAAQFLNAQTAAVIFANTPQGQALMETFVRTFRQTGGAVTFQGSIPTAATDTADLLVGALSSSPDVLYLPVLEPEGNLIVNTISRITGFGATTLLGGTGLFVPTFPQGVGSSAVSNMYVAGPVVQGPEAATLQADWQERFGTAPDGQVYGPAYDAANLLLTAVSNVAQEGRSGALLIGRQALRDALNETAVFPGATGNLTCSATGDCAADTAVGIYRLSAAQIDGQKWPPELVWMPGG
ncbi:MAG: branched-chain amino acid ABC transporter substrate-binding protein [Anaerolineales bacterium]|nr:branched-chain amino acid ABC transporter substrate-binding protein [Anaerolineales bacterium]